MIGFFMMGGPIMYPILLLAIVIVVLVITNVVRLFGRGMADARTQGSVNAILFWGTVAVVLGIFGQWSGLYMSASAIIRASVINPGAVFEGFAATLVTLISGLTVFIVAAFCWIVLHGRCRVLRAAGAHPLAGGGSLAS